MKKSIVFPVFLLLLVCLALFAVPAGAQEPGAPVSAADLISGAPHPLPIAGKVTMVDIGAHSCIPCKMMTPIIEELSREYDGRAVIAFIDVWEHREVAPEYGVTAIPTQIFYDAQGKERYRHVGYLDKQSIVARLAELGVR